MPDRFELSFDAEGVELPTEFHLVRNMYRSWFETRDTMPTAWRDKTRLDDKASEILKRKIDQSQKPNPRALAEGIELLVHPEYGNFSNEVLAGILLKRELAALDDSMTSLGTGATLKTANRFKEMLENGKGENPQTADEMGWDFAGRILEVANYMTQDNNQHI